MLVGGSHSREHGLVDFCQSCRLPRSLNINTCVFSSYINRKHYLVLPHACNCGVHCTKHSPYGTNQIGLTINFLKYNIFIINFLKESLSSAVIVTYHLFS